MSKLILLRHGQSEWNKLNLFTGWVDVPLSTEGIAEAFAAGQQLKDIPIDIIYTSTLIRAQMTAMLAMTTHVSSKVPVLLHTGEDKLESWSHIYSAETQKQTIPVIKSWELNERMYGELQGLNKAETMQKFGAEQVQKWRRSYDIAPPEGESLKMTAARSIPYFKEKIEPLLKRGKNVFICAHGNSLRSIMMHLDGLNEEQIVKLELATGMPVIYSYVDGALIKEPVLEV